MSRREPVVYRCTGEFGLDGKPVDRARLTESVSRQHAQIIAQLRDNRRDSETARKEVTK